MNRLLLRLKDCVVGSLHSRTLDSLPMAAALFQSQIGTLLFSRWTDLSDFSPHVATPQICHLPLFSGFSIAHNLPPAQATDPPFQIVASMSPQENFFMITFSLTKGFGSPRFLFPTMASSLYHLIPGPFC